jgi:hypothetical protein
MWSSDGINPRILNPGTRLRQVVSFMFRLLCPPGILPRTNWCKGGWYPDLIWTFGRREMVLSVPEIKLRFLGHQVYVRALLTMLTELSWLQNCVCRHVITVQLAWCFSPPCVIILCSCSGTKLNFSQVCEIAESRVMIWRDRRTCRAVISCYGYCIDLNRSSPLRIRVS